MPRQHSRPFIVSGSTAYPLDVQRVDVGTEDGLTEAWLQKLLFEQPALLPVGDIEPVFAPLVPVCRELPTGAGPLDILYGSSSGLLTLVECKLWKNPEARREVVGQILDYAKELSRWSYTDLQQTVSASKEKADGAENLYQLLTAEAEDVAEATFIDEVTRNLKRGRFLLLIVGEGIRESVEEISEFLQSHAHLNFAFALVETAIFTLPEQVGSGLLVAPRVLCRTVEIERAVVRIEGDGIVADSALTEAPGTRSGGARARTKISEQVFYEKLDAPPEMVRRLKEFLAKVTDLGLVVEAGSNSLMIKTDDGEFNFAVFRLDGTVKNLRIAKRTRQLGFPEVGERYLDQLAALFNGGEVDRSSHNPWMWTVRKDGRFLTVEECLAVEDKWLDLLRRALAEIEEKTR